MQYKDETAYKQCGRLSYEKTAEKQDVRRHGIER